MSIDEKAFAATCRLVIPPQACDNIRDFVEEYEAARNPWQPISSAPKDDEIFVIGESSNGKKDVIGIAKWHDTSYDEEVLISQNGSRSTYETQRKEDGYWDTVQIDGDLIFPTHWMPLPTSPKTQGE